MNLLMKATGRSRVCDWASFALLRDNVQHFLECGGVTERFSALHQIERAVDEGVALVEAPRLRGELLRAWCALWGIHLSDAAISLRTRALMTGALPPDGVVGTLVASQAGWQLPVPEGVMRVPQAAWRFMSQALAITEDAVDGDVIEVRRVGDAHAVASAPS
jgi:hypothetical protein